jgi:hypothetical protein
MQLQSPSSECCYEIVEAPGEASELYVSLLPSELNNLDGYMKELGGRWTNLNVLIAVEGVTTDYYFSSNDEFLEFIETSWNLLEETGAQRQITSRVPHPHRIMNTKHRHADRQSLVDRR